MERPSPHPVWSRQGRIRDWFHTKAGARFLNTGTSWFRLVAPPGYAVLTTIGRRTGKARRTAVRVIIHGNTGFLVSNVGEDTEWLRNIRADPQVQLRIGRRTTPGRVRSPRDNAERLDAKRAYAETINWFDYVSTMINEKGLPSRARIRSMHLRWFDQGRPLVVDVDKPS
jgi:deazaflavin-dependent oxidoreductase (nitroreductase family)